LHPVQLQSHEDAKKMQDREKIGRRCIPFCVTRSTASSKVSAKIHTGEVSVNYDIIADLVRAGWRRALP
jgi:hypothetical protein